MRLGLNESCRLAVAAVAVMAFGGGCNSFLDPSELGNKPTSAQQAPVIPILDTLGGGVEMPNRDFSAATPATAQDLVADTTDYRIGRNDLISVSVYDLVQVGVETVRTSRVTESGNISLPLIGQLQALGKTENELQHAVEQAYIAAKLLTSPQVSVTVQEARGRTFSIIGAVGQPSQYLIQQSNFRLLDALVLARDVTAQGSVDNIYIMRQMDEEQGGGGAQPVKPGGVAPSPDVLNPQPKSEGPAAPESKRVQLMQASAPAGEHMVTVDGKEVMVSGESADSTMAGAATAPAAKFEFNAPNEPKNIRTIKIPYEPLRNGEFKYNVVIRPNDLIIVPQPRVGEYYMGGHVQRTGVYSLTGRKITLKQAIVSAGMLDGLAIPSRTTLVRRIGDQEVFVKVDLDKVFDGSQSDMYLKPNDLINVGTDVYAPFLAALRGGFRITYGFGFLYDRNYAPEQPLR